ncbi:MAG TPA: hypothetical protein VGV93_04850 [Acidimicrobiales bacterium]|nr:hypothetical protein [Acidimicrobiales bacterium]
MAARADLAPAPAARPWLQAAPPALLDGSTDPVFLNSVQVEQLVREFQFVGELVDDPIVESHVHALIPLSGERFDGAWKDMIGIDFP